MMDGPVVGYICFLLVFFLVSRICECLLFGEREREKERKRKRQRVRERKMVGKLDSVPVFWKKEVHGRAESRACCDNQAKLGQVLLARSPLFLGCCGANGL